MFTGIIEEVGNVAAVQSAAGGRKLDISASFGHSLRIDQSVAVNGVCLTVEKASTGSFQAFVIGETLRKTTLGSLSSGSVVNLERAMTPDGRLDGHIVQGHVDTTGTVASTVDEGESRLITVTYDLQFDSLLVKRGSIAMDGVSLTVARLGRGQFTVAMIPQTLGHTTAELWRPGVNVNLEFDMLGKYVMRALEAHGLADSKSEITRSWLEEQGFS